MTDFGNTVAPILACGALIVMLFGVSAVTHLRSATRTAGMALLAFAFAGIAAVVETGELVPVRPLLIFGAACVAGALLALRVPLAARISQVGWISGLAAGAVALSSWSVLPMTQGTARIGAIASAALGLVSMAIAVFRLKETRDTPSTNVSVALALSLGGAAQLVAGVWNSQALLLVSGGVVSVAGVSLARAMANASGRTLGQLLFSPSAVSNAFGYGNVRHSDPEGAAMILAASQNVLIVPGYGLARAQGQHAVKELVERLEKSGAKVRIIVHHAAGIVPGHMNALLDEAGIAHSKLIESHEAAAALVGADVVVVGANDIVNSDAANQAGSLFGLDALNLSKAASVWVIKRSLGYGQGEVRNNLFELPQATMVLGDAKKVLQALVAELKNSAH